MGKMKSETNAPSHLTLRLFAPGMSLMHRAGLGGLACTLDVMWRQYTSGRLPADKLPGPVRDGQPPWTIDEQSITLDFGRPENARDYLRKLFEFAFQIRDGLIYLPGQFGDVDPPAPLLADLQNALLLTFLQHGRVRDTDKNESTVSYDIDERVGQPLIVTYKAVRSYRHQNGWEDFVNDSNCQLTTGLIKVDGPVCPGAVVRHQIFSSDTNIEEPPQRGLPLYFAMVGCQSIAVNRGVGVLLVPEVKNLKDFVEIRPLMTPRTSREAQIASAADAALQAEVRVYAQRQARSWDLPGIYAMTFMPTQWSTQQKSRVSTIYVEPTSITVLQRFERAMQSLPLKIVVPQSSTNGQGNPSRRKRKKESPPPAAIRVDSIVRPLIAENLALGRPWYANFIQLYIKKDNINNRPLYEKLPFECRGLKAMTDDAQMWDEEGERLIVQAVHEAIRYNLGRIRVETDGEAAKTISQATKNRWEKFREELRLRLSQAKTANDARHALCDLFSRAGRLPTLAKHWQQILPKLADDRWQLTRDLALLALASYSSETKDDEQPDTSVTQA